MPARHIIIGDIHGCHDELVELLDKVGLTDDDVLVSVGDLVDRGPSPTEVVRFFRGRPNSVVIMGNHERKHVRQVYSFSQEITRLQMGAGYDEAVAWMARLPYSHETDDVIVVHAGFAPGVPLAEQREDVLAGTTSGERQLTETLGGRRWTDLYEGPKPIAFGHHVVGDQPLVERGLIYGLDTGACHGGRLTALVVPGFEIVSVKARADHWRRTRREWQVRAALARSWPDMSWSKAARECDRLCDGDSTTEGESAAVEAIRAWIAEVEALIPLCLQRIIDEAARIAAESGAVGFDRHPLATMLHLAHRRRLDLDGVKQRCTTPRRTLAIAAALGLDLPAPAPPQQ